MNEPNSVNPDENPDKASSEIVFWDTANPFSVVNLVPDPLRVQLEYLSRSDKAYLLNLAESDLYRELDRSNQRPNATDNRLRIKFWFEYDRCHEMGLKKMVCANITARVCSREMFYKYYITNIMRLAWLLCPPASYTARMQEALNFGVDQVREILALPTEKMDKNVKLAAELKIRLITGLDDLLKGTHRKIGRRTKAVKDEWETAAFDTTPEEEHDPEKDLSEEEVLAELSALEAKNKLRTSVG